MVKKIVNNIIKRPENETILITVEYYNKKHKRNWMERAFNPGEVDYCIDLGELTEYLKKYGMKGRIRILSRLLEIANHIMSFDTITSQVSSRR